jgi:carboxymethylenebutenolidase
LTLLAVGGVIAIASTAGSAAQPKSGDAKQAQPRAAAVAYDTSHVHVGPAGGGTEAFVAWPSSKAAGPAVIVVHEWWGLNGQIREVARRLAQQGYVAIVPDLYHGHVASDPERAHELVRGLVDEAALVDLDATVAWLRNEPRVAKSKIGVVGFCMGGRIAQLLALRSDALSAAVMFYGPPEVDPTKLVKLRAPLQGHFGGEDQGIPRERVEMLRAGLMEARKPVDVHVYAGAGHAFMNDARPSHHPDASRQAWARTLAFLQKHLKG